MAEDPRTAAWRRLTETLEERAETYEAEGYEVATATADHGAAAVAEETGRLVFTVADNVADRVETVADGVSLSRTTVECVDVAGHRLFLLGAVDPDSETALLVAGGVERDAVDRLKAASTVQTVLRRADGRRAVVLEHDDVDPFVADV